MASKTQQEKAIKTFKNNLKGLLDNGFIVGDRKYTFSGMPFKMGRKINSFYTLIADDIATGSLMFSDTPKFEDEIEPLLMQYTLCDGHKLDTLEGHFDEFQGDWNEFMVNAILGHSAPFLLGNGTSSPSTVAENQTVTLKKQM